MSSNETPILVPGEPVHFVIAPGDRDVYLLPVAEEHPPMFGSYGGRETYKPARVIRCNVSRYCSRALEWDGRVGCADGEGARVLVVFRLAEVAILFCEVLADMVYQPTWTTAAERLAGVMAEAEV